jgi:hypothetical protein
MADVTPSALYPLIHDFLSENGLKKTLKAFKKEVDAVSDRVNYLRHFTVADREDASTDFDF